MNDLDALKSTCSFISSDEASLAKLSRQESSRDDLKQSILEASEQMFSHK